MAIDRDAVRTKFRDEIGRRLGRSERVNLYRTLDTIEEINAELKDQDFTGRIIDALAPMARRDLVTTAHIASALNRAARHPNSRYLIDGAEEVSRVKVVESLFDELKLYEGESPARGWAAAQIVLTELQKTYPAELGQLLRQIFRPDESRVGSEASNEKNGSRADTSDVPALR